MTNIDTNITQFPRPSIFDREPEPRMVIDFAKVEAAVKPADLAKEWNGGAAGPFFFQKAPWIVTKKGDDKWLDPKRRIVGKGAISLVAHARDISPWVAAPTLAEFAAIRDGVPADSFLSLMDRDQEAAQSKMARTRLTSQPDCA